METLDSATARTVQLKLQFPMGMVEILVRMVLILLRMQNTKALKECCPPRQKSRVEHLRAKVELLLT